MSRVEIVEQVIMIAAIGALIPFAFQYREPWYQWGLLSLVAVAMVAILVRRWRRMNQAMEEARASLEGATPTPPYLVTGAGNEKSKKGKDNGKNGR